MHVILPPILQPLSGLVEEAVSAPISLALKRSGGRRVLGTNFKNLLNRLLSHLSVRQIQQLDYGVLDCANLSSDVAQTLFPYPKVEAGDSPETIQNKWDICCKETEEGCLCVPEAERGTLGAILLLSPPHGAVC